MQAEPIVRVSGLEKSYAKVRALAGVSLELRAGEILGLLGPNGAGKSTLVKLVATLLRPDAGKAEIAGFDVATQPHAVRAAIGYVPQELTADKALTGRENLQLFCRLYHLPGPAAVARTRELLDLVGLGDAEGRLVRTYSGGMRKRLDLACGLVHKPRLLLLDEPSLGLDVHARRAIWDHILELRAGGMAILVATNSMEEAEALCQRLVIIDAGKVVATGSPLELKKELGGDVVALTFDAGGPPESLPARLAALPLVTQVAAASGRLELTVTSNEAALPAILDATRAAGAVVSEVVYSRPSLESVFLRATGRRFGEPAPKL